MSRDRNAREANDFVAQRIRDSATPAQQRAIVAEAERKGLLRPGEGRIVDGRVHSETISKIVAGGARSDES